MYYTNTPWVPLLQSAKKTTLLQAGKRKVHYTLPDNTELAEEYDGKTNQLLMRKWRIKNKFGGIGKWEVEIGEPESNFSAVAVGNEHIIESFSNPICYRQDTVKAFQWRVRNLPYALENYKLTVEKNSIVVRTVNKKYYKVIEIPDMVRAKLSLSEENLTFAHSNNTLIIQYVKPELIIKEQNLIISEIKKIKTAKDGDMECNQS